MPNPAHGIDHFFIELLLFLICSNKVFISSLRIVLKIPFSIIIYSESKLSALGKSSTPSGKGFKINSLLLRVYLAPQLESKGLPIILPLTASIIHICWQLVPQPIFYYSIMPSKIWPLLCTITKHCIAQAIKVEIISYLGRLPHKNL